MIYLGDTQMTNNIKELKMKHRYGALIHNELTVLINDENIETRAEAHKLAKELGYAIMPYGWNKSLVYPSRGILKTLGKLA
jgi:hypothetical protein